MKDIIKIKAKKKNVNKINDENEEEIYQLKESNRAQNDDDYNKDEKNNINRLILKDENINNKNDYNNMMNQYDVIGKSENEEDTHIKMEEEKNKDNLYECKNYDNNIYESKINFIKKQDNANNENNNNYNNNNNNNSYYNYYENKHLNILNNKSDMHNKNMSTNKILKDEYFDKNFNEDNMNNSKEFIHNENQKQKKGKLYNNMNILNDEENFSGLVIKNKEHNKKIYENSKCVNTLNEKWKLLPAYLKVKGLVKQHIESYNYFIKREIKTIMNATTNKIIKSDIDEHFYVEFLDITVGTPSVEENMIETRLTPQICRQRDLTYSAPIYVDVEYVKGNSIITKNNVEIGRLPVMLRSDICVLNNKNEEELMKLGECPYDPGGYFIVKGTERVLLMQEQLSKNRIIVEMDIKHNICATITSTTAESKSRCAIVYKNNKLYLKHNSFIEDIGVCIILRAMGYESDQEIFQMIGSHKNYVNGILLSLYELYNENIKTNLDALLYIGK
ncbi:DNA-directed RNA polymerase III subunit, putative, partial [Plasmodium sp. gorilla clade G3]